MKVLGKKIVIQLLEKSHKVGEKGSDDDNNNDDGEIDHGDVQNLPKKF